MPLYAWYVLVAAFMVLFAFPPLIAGTLLLELERAFGWPFFDPRGGGDPLLWQHLFWIFGHPEVYIIFLPSVALIAMIVPTVRAARRSSATAGSCWRRSALASSASDCGCTTCSRPGCRAISLALFLGRVGGGRHPDRRAVLLLHRHAAGRARHALGADALRRRRAGDLRHRRADRRHGGDGAVQLPGARHLLRRRAPALRADRRRACSRSSPASTTTSRWSTAKQLSERLGRVAVLAGVRRLQRHLPADARRRACSACRAGCSPTRPASGSNALNLVSTIGAFVLAAGFAVVVVGRPAAEAPAAAAPRNPWNAGTLEWLQEMPGPALGRALDSRDRQPLSAVGSAELRPRRRRGPLLPARCGRRPTRDAGHLERSMPTPVQCLRIAGPTFITLVGGVFVGGIFIFPHLQACGMAAASARVLALAVIIWSGCGPAPREIPEKDDKDVGLGLTLPLYVSGRDSVGWWAMFITMLGDLTAFVSLVFGYFFYWTHPRRFPAGPDPGPGVFWPALAVALAWWARRGRSTVGCAPLNAATGPALRASCLRRRQRSCAAVGAWAGRCSSAARPDRHVYPAIVWLLVIWSVVHVAVGVGHAALLPGPTLAGRMPRLRHRHRTTSTLYWHFIAAHRRRRLCRRRPVSRRSVRR